jgi:hypothetical protein
VAILIDEAQWPWREWLWCHMVSDTSTDELIAFADSIGLPSRGFQGDHYDVPEHMRQVAIDNGATVVSTRTILAALYQAGIRLRPAQRHIRPTSMPTHQP